MNREDQSILGRREHLRQMSEDMGVIWKLKTGQRPKAGVLDN